MFKNQRISLLSFALILCLAEAVIKPVFANSIEFSSGEKQNIMLELFTSEGCSSCPPAEAWINTFINHKDTFTTYVPLAFHVDYWNYLGWEDRFASKQHSRRQKEHYLHRNLSQVYTPGMLRNSQEYRRWHGNKNPETNTPRVGKLSARINDQKINISFAPYKDANVESQQGWILNVALLGFGLKTEIKAGENHGKTLSHEFVVLTHHAENVTHPKAGWQIPLPTSDIAAEKYALAVWLENGKTFKMIQVTAGWL